MTGSTLVTATIPAHANNFRKTRSGEKLTDFILHHMAADSTVESIGSQCQSPTRYMSPTYSVNEKAIGQHVSEEDEPYTSSNRIADRRAITIEIANSGVIRDAVKAEIKASSNPNRAIVYADIEKHGNILGWPITDVTLDTTIRLMADCMKRNNYAPLVVGQNLKWHSMFANTGCPGPYIMSKLQYIADTCNGLVFPVVAENDEAWFHAWPFVLPDGKTVYRVVKQIISLSDKDKAEAYARELSKK